MKIFALLIALLTLSPLPPDEVEVARATGLSLSSTEFGEWLVDRFGVLYVKDFMTEQIVLREARARGLYPSDEDVAAEWEAERSRIVEMLHKGSQEHFEADLAARGFSLETWVARRSAELTFDLCEIRLAQADRAITEEALQSRFRDIYGESGEQTILEILFFNAYSSVGTGDERPDIGRLKSLALERARKAREAWAAGADLDQLRPDSDPIHSEFVQDGRVSAYRRSLLGPAVDKAVNSLDRPGDISLPVEVFDGSYLVRLVERRPVSLDSVRDELTRMLAAEPATSGERAEMREALLAREQAEVMLR